MKTPLSSTLFPLGSHLCRDPMPPLSELFRDLEILKQKGFNLIKLQIPWMTSEPIEGELDVGRFEELITRAAALDMGVYIAIACEQAPAWLYRKYPDCRMVGRDGRPILYEAPTTLPADGKPGPCFDHPGARNDLQRFVHRLISTLARHENIRVWETWQEIGYWAEGLVGQSVCFCPHTIAAWYRWLQRRYGCLETLNKAWNTRYPSWESIQPSRAARQPQAVDLAWQEFMDNDQIAETLRVRADAIRAADPLKRPVFAHKGGPAYASEEDWAYARCHDFMGVSSYPAWVPFHSWDDGNQRPFERHSALLMESLSLVYNLDCLRSVNRGKGHAGGSPFWAAEFQGGPIVTGLQKGRMPAPEDIRRWMLLAVGGGVTGISFWVTRAEIMAAEGNGFSLLDSVGDTTERLEEAGRIGDLLQRHSDLFAVPSLSSAPAAILVNETNYQLCNHLHHAGNHLPYSTRGWWRLLWEAGVTSDFLAAHYDREYISRYQAIIAPFPIVLETAILSPLLEYVRKGGCLICEVGAGRVNEHGFCVRGEWSPLLAEVTGCRQRSFGMVREPEGGNRWSPAERTWGEFLEPLKLRGSGPLSGCELTANVFLQTFDCGGSAEIVLRAGDVPAGFRVRVGKGWIWVLGTVVGHSGFAYRSPAVTTAMKTLVEVWGLSREEGPCLIRRRSIPGKEAVLIFNPFAEPRVQQIPVGPHARCETWEGCSLIPSEGKVSVSVPPLDVIGVIIRE